MRCVNVCTVCAPPGREKLTTSEYHLGVRARWRCCCGRAAAMVMAMVAQLYKVYHPVT